MTMFTKWAVAGLLLPNALDAFVPSSSSSSSTVGTFITSTTTLYATINATETRRQADPFLNNFLDGPSSSSRFVRYDKKRDKASLVDTSTDDFINKYNSGGLGRKPTGGNANAINRDGSVKIESSLGSSFSSSSSNDFPSNKFERYDKKKFGNLILGQENENKNNDFVNKRNPTQSSIHVNNNNNKQDGSSYPQHMKRSTQQSSSSSASTVNLDGVELKRFNWKEDKSLFSPPATASTSQDEFVQDPRMAATARRPPKSAANESRIRRERQENVSFPRTPGSSTTPSGTSYYPKTTPSDRSSTSSTSSGSSYYPKTTISNNDNELDWLKQREQRGGQELSSSNTDKPKSYRAPDDWLSQGEQNDGKREPWQASPVQFENVYQAPPAPEQQDTSFRPGRFVTRSGADVSQHISEKKGPDGVVGSAFSVSERKPVRPEPAAQQSSRRSTSATSGQRKPVMPAAIPSLKRDFYRSPEQVQATRKATYTAQPPPARPAPQKQEKPEISMLDARVLRELLQTDELDAKTEAALIELLEKERSGYAPPPQQERRPQQPERRPTMPRGQEPERRPTMPQERRPNTPRKQERSPTMQQQEHTSRAPQQERRPSMERGSAMKEQPRPTMPVSSRTGTAIPPRRRRTSSTGEDEESRKARQKIQAERNRAALLEQYNSISDEEMIMYGMKVSGNQEVEPESKSLPPPPKYGWNEYGIEDGFMDNYQEYHSYFEQQEQKQAPTLKETPKAAAKTSAKESDKKDPREGKTESNEWVNLGDPRSPGFMGFSDSEFKLQGGDSSSISSSSEQWWKRNDWDSSQEVVIMDYAGDDYKSGSVQPQKPEPKAEEPDDNSDGGIPKPKAPGFVGFSNIDWSQQR